LGPNTYGPERKEEKNCSRKETKHTKVGKKRFLGGKVLDARGCQEGKVPLRDKRKFQLDSVGARGARAPFHEGRKMEEGTRAVYGDKKISESAKTP